jgi:hypothetical protein
MEKKREKTQFRITQVSSFNQQYKVKKNGRRQCQPLLQNYFDFYTANLNIEKNTERFLGSNLQCCLHVTVLLAIINMNPK